MLTKVCIVRDNSQSMNQFTSSALTDFNSIIENLQKEETSKNKIAVSVVEFCGHSHSFGRSNKARVGISNVPAKKIKKYEMYSTEVGHTPLFDAVNLAISTIEDTQHTTEDIAYLVMITTDGEENSSTIKPFELRERIESLIKTDKWTFVFRVPKGCKNNLINMLQISPGNIMEWELTEKALRQSTIVTSESTTTYFQDRAAGFKATRSFYSNLDDVSLTQVKQNLTDITNQIKVEPVWAKENDFSIKSFCMTHFGEYKAGRAYYELNKPEDIQPNKKIVVKHKSTGCYYGGDEARQLLKLPNYSIKVKPGDHGDYDVFVQSTSYNRKLKEGSLVVYW